MQHYHFTNINHSHGVTDPGHNHSVVPNEDRRYPIVWRDNDGASHSGWPRVTPWENENVRGSIIGAASSLTGITVNEIGYDYAWKYSSGSLANDQWAGRTETDSNNQSATETRPTNFTVKIWKRTA